jgi:hypothetical protein
MRPVRLILPVLAALAVLAAACDGSSGGEDSSPTPAATATSEGMGPSVVTDGHIRSERFGYEAAIPQGWSATPSFISSATSVIDQLVADMAPSAAPTITIECKLEVEAPPADWEADEIARAGQLAVGDVTQGMKTVAGAQRVALDYLTSATTPGTRLHRTAVLVPSDPCYFVLLLTATSDVEASAAETFDEFLSGFALLH